MATGYHDLGMLAQLRGDYDEAAPHYQRALDIAEPLGNQVGMARSYHELGGAHGRRRRCLARPGSHRPGTGHLPVSHAARAGRDADLDALTAPEREVLALIGQCKTNAEIAAELFVGEGTVKTHINHLFTKLQLRDRAAAVVFAFDHDLATPRPG